MPCPHCWPTKTTSHVQNHLDYYHEKLVKLLPKRKKETHFWGAFLELLALFKLVEFVDDPDTRQLYNRSLIFFKEAKKRGLNIQAVKAFGKYDNTFKVLLKGKTFYYDGIPLNIIGQKKADLDNKFAVKKILQKYGFPVADGGLFTSAKKAIQFVQSIDFPVIVKPNTGSLSHHVSDRIDNLNELQSAIKIVQQYRPDFIVERFIDGKLFRATVIAKKHVFVCQKEPANVVGNGKSTTRELIDKKNKSRYENGRKDATIHKIITNKNRKLLKKILPKGQKHYLQKKIILSAGCDVISCTETTHEANKKMFLKVAEVLDSDLVGIDFICQTIEKPYYCQQSAIIETNSLPYVDMHQFPSHGKPDPVAQLVWDSML